MRPINFLVATACLLVPVPVFATTAQDEVDLANKLAKQGCYDSAVIFYDKALSFTPGYGPAIAGRAAALKAMKKGAKKTPETTRKQARAQKIEKEKEKERARKLKEEIAKRKNEARVAAENDHQKAESKPKAKATAALVPELSPSGQATKVSPAETEAAKTPETYAPAKKHAETAKKNDELEREKQAASYSGAEEGVHERPIAIDSTSTHRPHVSESPIGGAAPPLSSSASHRREETSYSSDDAVPGWLIVTALGTFVLLIVLSAVWLTPSLSSSRQLHKRLKGLERTREER